MAPQDPTSEYTINDVFARLGSIETGIGKLWEAHNATNTRLAVLDATLRERCAQHQKDIDAVAGQNRKNGDRITVVENAVSSAKAGWSTAKVIGTIIVTTITTVGVVSPIIVVVMRHFLTIQ